MNKRQTDLAVLFLVMLTVGLWLSAIVTFFL
jgi:hypothetical protein